jgi:hypothetical protein
MKVSRLLFFAGLGAALMYLFDPQNGEHRRAQLRDQAVTLRGNLQDEFEGRSTYLADSARNLATEARNMAQKLEDTPQLNRSASQNAGSEG